MYKICYLKTVNLSWGSFYSLSKIGKYNNGMLKGNVKGGTVYGTRINFNEKDYYKMSENFDKMRQEIEMIDKLLVRPEGWDK